MTNKTCSHLYQYIDQKIQNSRKAFAAAGNQQHFTKLFLIASLPDGLAWDWVNRKLYWTDAEDNDIEVIDPLSNHRKVLISTGNATYPRAIVVDPKNKYVR